MSAAFSFGPLGAMTDLVVAPSVQVDNGRELKTTTTSRGVRWAQRARRNPRTWTVSRPWQDPQFARLLSLAASGLGGDMYLYDRACARQNMLPAHLSAGVQQVASTRTNLATGPSFELGIAQPGFPNYNGGGATTTLDTEWAASGVQSIKITPATSTSSGFYPVSRGSLPSALLTPGKTYTIGATIRLADAQTGSTGARTRVVTVGVVAADGSQNFNYAVSNQAANSAGATRLVVTATIPADAQGAFILLANGSTSTPVWYDQLTIEEGSTDGSYFDGDTPGARWSGVRGASTSVLTILDPGVPVDGVAAGIVTWQNIPIYLLAGRTYTLSCWTTATSSPASLTLPGALAQAMPAPVGGLSVLTVTPTAEGLATITRTAARVSGVRVHEGVPDGRFYATEGTPCRVAVADPEQTYQMVTARETRIDYQATLYEVGSAGTF